MLLVLVGAANQVLEELWSLLGKQGSFWVTVGRLSGQW